jgi:hypothetical protein
MAVILRRLNFNGPRAAIIDEDGFGLPTAPGAVAPPWKRFAVSQWRAAACASLFARAPILVDPSLSQDEVQWFSAVGTLDHPALLRDFAIARRPQGGP